MKAAGYKQIDDPAGNIILTPDSGEAKRISLMPVDENGNIIPAKSKIKNALPAVNEPAEFKPDTSLNIFEKIRAKIYTTKKEIEVKMLQTLKGFITRKLTEWILAIGAGIFAALGVSQNSIEEIIAAVVSFVIGIAFSLITHKKVALTDPKTFEIK